MKDESALCCPCPCCVILAFWRRGKKDIVPKPVNKTKKENEFGKKQVYGNEKSKFATRDTQRFMQ